MNDLLLLQAFIAGILGFFTPCTVAMLPAYIGHLLKQDGADAPSPNPRRRGLLLLGAVLSVAGAAVFVDGLVGIRLFNQGAVSLTPRLAGALIGGGALAITGLVIATRGSLVARGLSVGAQASLGVLTVFFVLGIPLARLTSGISLSQLALVLIALGAIVTILGLLMLAGRELTLRVPGSQLNVDRLPQSARSYGFGLGYGLISLGCNFPIFLLVVTTSVGQQGLAAASATFLAYGLGVATLMIPLSAAAAVGRATGPIRRVLPHIKRVTGAFVALAGIYIVYYYTVVWRTGAAPALEWSPLA